MSEKARYYTPEMKEFHDGFEYEIMLPDGKYHHRVFGEQKVGHPQLEQYGDDLMKIAHAITRVKHLDREDIESLGFKDIDGDLVNSTGDLIVADNPPMVKIFRENAMGTAHHRVFNGTIRNKSELKRIMEMTGIKTGE